MLNSKLTFSLDKEDCEILWINKNISVKGLYRNKNLDLNLLRASLLNKGSFKYEEYKGIKSIIVGEIKENPVGEIVVSILKNLKFTKDCSFLNLEIYLKDEINLQDIANIEDPIREYLDEGLKINIKQYLNKKNENIDHFIVKCLK